MLQIMTRKISIQIICDEPPQDLETQWQKDRIEFYKRLEPVDKVRDEKPIPCGTALARGKLRPSTVCTNRSES